MAEPGSSLLRLKPPSHSLGPADFGQLSQEPLNNHQGLFLHFYLCLVLREFLSGGREGLLAWGVQVQSPNLLQQPRKHLVT